MMSQNIARDSDNLPQKIQGSKEFEDDVATSLRACKTCGEIGHTSKECYEQCPHCDTSHPSEACPTINVSCCLCEGTDHVLAQCHLYPLVQRMNQQARDGIFQSIGKIPEDNMLKMSKETEVKSHEAAHPATTKCCYTCGEEGHISNHCTRKRERFPTYIVEYGDQQIEDLLALEKPKKKKKYNNSKEKDLSQVICYSCRYPGHYADKCPESRMNEAKEHRKDINLVTCFKCKEEGHYANECPEKNNVSFKKKDPSLVTCFKCGNQGHYANKCPERNNSMTAYRQPTNMDN